MRSRETCLVLCLWSRSIWMDQMFRERIDIRCTSHFVVEQRQFNDVEILVEIIDLHETTVRRDETRKRNVSPVEGIYVEDEFEIDSVDNNCLDRFCRRTRLDWQWSNECRCDIWLILELIFPFRRETRIPVYTHIQMSSSSNPQHSLHIARREREKDGLTGFWNCSITCRMTANVSSNLLDIRSEIIWSMPNIDEIYSLLSFPSHSLSLFLPEWQWDPIDSSVEGSSPDLSRLPKETRGVAVCDLWELYRTPPHWSSCSSPV